MANENHTSKNYTSKNEPIQINRIQQKRKLSAGFRRLKILVLLVLLFSVVGVTLVSIAGTLDDIAVTDARLADVQQQIEDEEARRAQIEDAATYTQTISFIEDVARRRLGLVRRDEVIFIINSD